jgi:hypothetical protein
MAFQLVCSVCHREYDPASLPWRCACGGLLDVAPFKVDLSPGAIHRTQEKSRWAISSIDTKPKPRRFVN